MYWGPHLEILEGTVHLDSLEIRVYLGRLELLDYLVGRTNYYNCSKVAFLIILFPHQVGMGGAVFLV